MLNDSTETYRIFSDRHSERRHSRDGGQLSVSFTEGGSDIVNQESTRGEEIMDDSISVFATRISWAINIFLVITKGLVFAFTLSIAILGSFLDSVTDIFSQGFLAYAESEMENPEALYPVGKSKLESNAVITCAWFQIFLAINTMTFAGIDVYVALAVSIPSPDASIELYVLLFTAVGLKIFAFFYCKLAVNHTKNKDLMSALATDHLNDVVSNAAAIIALAIADSTTLWWMDPLGAVLISFFVIHNWAPVLRESYSFIVGEAAPETYNQELQDDVRRIVLNLGLEFSGFNRCLVYHSGARYIVEIEIAFGSNTSMESSAEATATIIDLIEAREEVERAFVFSEFNLRARHLHRSDRDYFEDRQPATDENKDFKYRSKQSVFSLLSYGGIVRRRIIEPKRRKELSRDNNTHP